MTSPPFFTVIIPTYNRPEYLRQAIQSVLDQTFEDFELLVIDDSPEETACPVAKGFKDERLKYLRNDQKSGGAGTRNAGITRAQGQWVAFLDDDDLWLPAKLERQAEQIENTDNDVALVYTGHTTFSSESEQTHSFIPEKAGWIYEDLLAWNVIKGLYSVAIKRDVLNALGGLDERFPALQDLELYVRVAKSNKVAFIKEPLVRVRNSSSGRITTNYANKLRGSQLFREKFKDDINESLRLKHRAAARVFMFAFAEGKVREMFKSAPLTLVGLVRDLKSVKEVMRFVVRVSIANMKAMGHKK